MERVEKAFADALIEEMSEEILIDDEDAKMIYKCMKNIRSEEDARYAFNRGLIFLGFYYDEVTDEWRRNNNA